MVIGLILCTGRNITECNHANLQPFNIRVVRPLTVLRTQGPNLGILGPKRGTQGTNLGTQEAKLKAWNTRTILGWLVVVKVVDFGYGGWSFWRCSL